MKTFLVTFILMCMAVGVPAAQELLPWTVETIYPTASAPSEQAGPCARVAINPLDEHPVVVSLATGDEPGDQMVELIGGYLTPSQHSLFALSSDLDADFWMSPTMWKLGVSYRNQSDQSLRLYQVVNNSVTGTLSTGFSRIQDEENFEYGHGTSIRYDSTGTPHIATHVRPVNLGIESLMYATYVGTGGNCGVLSDAGEWSCQTIDAGDEVGRDPSLTIDGADQPVIAYTKPWGEVDLVFVARPTSTGAGSCGGGFWNCGYVDSDILAYDQSNAAVTFDRSPAQTGIHIAYHATAHYSSSPTYVEHAVWAGDGVGSCGLPANWNCEDLPNEVGTASGNALEIGTNASGLPVIAFPSPSHDEIELVEDLGVNFAGNCGIGDRWRCAAIESDLGTPDVIGEWLDLAVTGDGQPVVAYSKLIHDTLRYQLKLAYPWIFRDSFEYGLTKWSSSAQ